MENDDEFDIPPSLDRRTKREVHKFDDANDQSAPESSPSKTANDLVATEKESHPYADMFPRMRGKEIEGLVASIEKDGQEEPIVLYEGKILDGRNRYAACTEAKVEPKYIDYKGEEPLDFVLRKNVLRRQLQTSQRAMIAANLVNMKQGERTDLEPSANLQKVSVEKAAEMVGVSPRTVEHAKSVLACGDDELIKAAESGIKTVSAAVRQLTATSVATESNTEGERQSQRLLKLWDKTGDDGRELFRKAIGINAMISEEEKHEGGAS